MISSQFLRRIQAIDTKKKEFKKNANVTWSTATMRNAYLPREKCLKIPFVCCQWIKSNQSLITGAARQPYMPNSYVRTQFTSLSRSVSVVCTKGASTSVYFTFSGTEKNSWLIISPNAKRIENTAICFKCSLSAMVERGQFWLLL